MQKDLEFDYAFPREEALPVKRSLAEQLAAFQEFGNPTQVVETLAKTFRGQRLHIPTYINEFWTSKQRAANSLHEVSYRACYQATTASLLHRAPHTPRGPRL